MLLFFCKMGFKITKMGAAHLIVVLLNTLEMFGKSIFRVVVMYRDSSKWKEVIYSSRVTSYGSKLLLLHTFL